VDSANLLKVVDEGINNSWKHYNRDPTTPADFARLKEVDELINTNLPALRSVYGTYQQAFTTADSCEWNGEPSYTSYAKWHGTIDYIFQVEGDTQLKTVGILEIPPEAYIQKLVSLPNDLYGSDHVCIQAEFVLQ